MIMSPYSVSFTLCILINAHVPLGDQTQSIIKNWMSIIIIIIV